MNVFVHIGLAKTGTTSLQDAFGQQAEALAEQGVLYAGGTYVQQMRAVYDLMGRSIPGNAVAAVPGSFDKLVAEIQAWSGPTALISHETLALARPKQIGRLMAALEPHTVHLVVTVRDFGRVLCSAWQQEIFQGGAYPWPTYAATIRDPGAGPTNAGVAFWLRQDIARVLRPWSRSVPADRIHVVTVPPSGSPSELLFDRFGQVLGLPAGGLAAPEGRSNPSVGVAELEVLRRLSSDLIAEGARLRNFQLLRPDARARLITDNSRPLVLPEAELPWVTERAEQQIAAIRAGGYDVVGDLDDLRPRATAGSTAPHEVTDAELLDASGRALVVVSRELAQMTRRNKRLASRLWESGSVSERLVHGRQAAGFRLRLAALERAEHSKVFGWAARAYLKRGAK